MEFRLRSLLFGAFIFATVTGCSLRDAPEMDNMRAEMADMEDRMAAAQSAAQTARLRFNDLERKIQNLPNAPSDLVRDADALNGALAEMESLFQ